MEDKPVEAKSTEAPKPQRAHHEHPKARLLAIGLIMLLSTSFGFVGGWLGAGSQGRGLSGSAEQGRQLAEDQSTLISGLAEQVGPSVVSVEVTSNQTQVDPFFGTQTGKVRSAGTGFIISDDGYVLTNRHVIPKGTTKVSLTLSDGTTLDDVSVVGRTSSSDPLDIAFLKIEDKKGKTLKPVKLGNSDDLKVGDLAVAIGNALGEFQNTVTSGIISGFGRNVEAGGEADEVESLQNLIQTDAAINQGNSGGPLVNVNGEVIGVNTAVAAGDAQSIGFAIPINDVKGLINSVLDSGKVQRPYLGVRYVQLNPEIAKEVGVDQEQGAYVPKSSADQLSVIPGSPAAESGVKDGDVITKVNDQDITEDDTLSSAIAQYKVGDKVKLTIMRDGKEVMLDATLEQMPGAE